MTQKRSRNSSKAWTAGRAMLDLAPAAIGAMLLVGLDARASDLVVTGNIDVSGIADIRGNELTLGTSGTNSSIPGITLTYHDAVISGTSESSLLRFTATRASHGWVWEHENENQTATVPMMKMDSDHVLTIYDVLGNPAITLDPSGNSSSSNVLTVNSADNRYVRSESFQVSWDTLGRPSLAFSTGTASGPYSLAGPGATASGAYATAFGPGAKAASGNVAIGNNSEASGEEASAFGSGAKATGHITFSVGIAAKANAAGGTAYNTDAKAEGFFSTARGIGSTALGNGSTASGSFSQAEGARSVASGPFSLSVGVESIAAGYQTVSLGMGQFVVGRFNVPQGHSSQWIPEDDLFVVGNGSVPLMSGTSVQKDSAGNTLYQPSNAFVVKKNGNTVVYGNLTVSGTADVQSPGVSLGVYNAEISSPKVSMHYEAASGGNNPALNIKALEEGLEWNWRRVISGTGVPAMQLDTSNRLILTGTAADNPPQLVLDPNVVDGPTSVLTQASADERYVVNGGSSATTLSNTIITGGLTISGTATANGSTLLTQTAADTRYLPAASGLTLLNGRLGIGTTTPAQLLHIKGVSARLKIEGSGWDNPVLEMAGPNYTNYLFVNQTDGGWYLRTDSLSRHVFIQAGGPNSGGANQGRVQIGGMPTPPPPPESQLVVRGNTNLSTFGLLDVQSYSGTSAFFVRSDGRVGIKTTSPQASLDVNGDGRISGNLAVSGSGSLTLPDGTILSASNTLQGVVAGGTALAISGTIPVTQVSGLSSVATTGSYSSLSGLPTIPVNTNQLTNGAGYITSSGTAAFAQAAASLSGTIQATQVTGLSGVATSGDYASLSGLPTIPTDTNQLANGAGYVTASGTTSGITLSGTTKVAEGGIIVTGTAVQVTSGTTTITKIVSSGSNHLVLIPEQGDLSMGTFTAGPIPQ